MAKIQYTEIDRIMGCKGRIDRRRSPDDSTTRIGARKALLRAPGHPMLVYARLHPMIGQIIPFL